MNEVRSHTKLNSEFKLFYTQRMWLILRANVEENGNMALSNSFRDYNTTNYHVGEVKCFPTVLGKFFKEKIILAMRCS